MKDKQQSSKSPKKKWKARRIKATSAIPLTKENYSRRDWEDIMGMRMQTLHKKNGAWRRK